MTEAMKISMLVDFLKEENRIKVSVDFSQNKPLKIEASDGNVKTMSGKVRRS